METIRGDRNATGTNMCGHNRISHTQTHSHPQLFITQAKPKGRGWQGLKPAARMGSRSCKHGGPNRTLDLPKRRTESRFADRVIKTPLTPLQRHGSNGQLTSSQPGNLSLSLSLN